MPCSPDLPVAILAGGLGTRLGPLSAKIPKSLVEVAGRPFLAHQLDLLREQGIRRAVVCIGHLGEMIQDEFGDGSGWGIELRYSLDGPALLGTGGALAKAAPMLGEEFFVLYGDSYLSVDFGRVAEAFRASGKPALMTVFANDGRWDASNVLFEQGAIKAYDKRNRRPGMRHIDYGLLCLRSEVFADGAARDLADLLGSLAASGQLAGLAAAQRFYEIGSPAGLRELAEALAREPRP